MSDPSFRTVLRGYEPAQVDQRLSELTEHLHASQDRAAELAREVEQLGRRLAAQQAAPAPVLAPPAPAAPTFADLGARIAQILTLAEEEAAELLARAEAEALAVRTEAEAAALLVRTEADRYDATVRSDTGTEVQRMTSEALRRADDVLDAAERDATARREEAEALWERQRAQAAQAAADFELTLAARRERAEREFAERTAVAEAQLAAAEEAALRARSQSEREVAEASARARRLLEDAQDEADQLASDARARADRIRAESERELTAASQRRDSINAQLTNVRQMLATLSGGAPVIGLEEPVEQAPAALSAGRVQSRDESRDEGRSEGAGVTVIQLPADDPVPAGEAAVVDLHDPARAAKRR